MTITAPVTMTLVIALAIPLMAQHPAQTLRLGEVTSAPWNPNGCPVTVERTAKINGSDFAVTFRYDQCGISSVPATMPLGQSHYRARITVWEILKGGKKRKQVGSTFDGEFTEKGCTEDEPVKLVKKALETEKVK